jgi:hypothetical protein
MQIALVNHSTRLKTSDMAAICTALNTQMRLHAAPAWDLTPASFTVATSEAAAPAKSKLLVAFDNADQAGALGYHDETPQGVEYARVFAGTTLQYNGGKVLQGALSVASVFSHEALEMWRDQRCNEWAQASDGTLYAIELGDPVENDGYDITVNLNTRVTVSNFVLPAWFDATPPAGSKYDYMGRLTRHFSMTSGGYMIKQTGGRISEVFGEHYPEWKKAGKAHPAARTARRKKPHQPAAA